VPVAFKLLRRSLRHFLVRILAPLLFPFSMFVQFSCASHDRTRSTPTYARGTPLLPSISQYYPLLCQSLTRVLQNKSPSNPALPLAVRRACPHFNIPLPTLIF
jgi:hypothetical protein